MPEFKDISSETPNDSVKPTNKKAIYLAVGALSFVCLTITLAIILLPKLINWEKQPDDQIVPSVSTTITPTFDENPFEENGSPRIVYKYLGNDIEVFDIVKNAGGRSECQPLTFDPNVDKYSLKTQPGTPSKLYEVEGFEGGKMMINGWLTEGSEKINAPAPFTVNFYEFVCASSASYTLDILKSGVRQKYFPHVENFKFTEDGRYAFIIYNNVDNTQVNKIIYDLVNNTSVEVPNPGCNTLDAMWQGDRLLTYSNLQNTEEFTTDLCVWDKSANLLGRVNLNNYWSSASRDILSEPVGLLPENPDILFFYTASSNDYNNKCSLYTVDLKNNPRSLRSAIILGKGGFMCVEPNVEFDFSGLESTTGSIKYRYEQNNSWTEWTSANIK